MNSSARSRQMSIDASRPRFLLQLAKPTVPIGTLGCVVAWLPRSTAVPMPPWLCPLARRAAKAHREPAPTAWAPT